MDIFKLVARYPRLYHMAEYGSWPNIRAHGLLSTHATLDRANLPAADRFRIESQRRPEKVTVDIPKQQPIVLRDQKPMSDARLRQCLQDQITPQQWYEFLNGKVFFWATEERLYRLLNAYGDEEHDVLTINTESLIEAHQRRIMLCHMNSGNTTPWAHPRSFETFKVISDYPAKPNGNPIKEVAEVVVDDIVADIAHHVVSVRRMKGERITSQSPYGVV